MDVTAVIRRLRAEPLSPRAEPTYAAGSPLADAHMARAASAPASAASAPASAACPAPSPGAGEPAAPPALRAGAAIRNPFDLDVAPLAPLRLGGGGGGPGAGDDDEAAHALPPQRAAGGGGVSCAAGDAARTGAPAATTPHQGSELRPSAGSQGQPSCPAAAAEPDVVADPKPYPEAYVSGASGPGAEVDRGGAAACGAPGGGGGCGGAALVAHAAAGQERRKRCSAACSGCLNCVGIKVRLREGSHWCLWVTGCGYEWASSAGAPMGVCD